MGYNNYVSMGAYLEVFGTYDFNIDEKQCLKDSNHNINHRDNFCSECGSIVGKVGRSETRNISDYWDLFDDIEDQKRFTDVMYTPEHCSGSVPQAMVVMGNRNDSYAGVSNRSKEINESTIKVYVDAFKEDYAEFLEFLDNSKFTYEIKFGVIHYTS